MINIMQKNRGAISIFLVIVLVPMLILSSVFVDMSRLNLAKAVAESAGTLTLNTALTNYDAVLKDMYGLFATSQDTDELFDNLENYYKQCIESAGVAEPDADNYVDQIMQLLRSETGTDDLLNMNLTSFEVTKPTGGSLANPAVLKEQIVEFMKYRAPINLGTGIFDALSSMKNIKKQSELVDNKNKFYAQQTSMMEKLEQVWNALEDYQYRDAYRMYEGDKCTFPDGKYLEYSEARMLECIDKLNTALAYTVRYIYPAINGSYRLPVTNSFGRYAVEVKSQEDMTEADKEQYSEIWLVGDMNAPSTYYVPIEQEEASLDDVKECLQTAYYAIRYLSKFKSTHNLAERLSNAIHSETMSDFESIKLICEANNLVTDDYVEKFKRLIPSLIDLKNAKLGYENAEHEQSLDSYYVIEGENYSLTVTDDYESAVESGHVVTLGYFAQTQINHLNERDRFIEDYNNTLEYLLTLYNDVNSVVEAARKNVKTAVYGASTYADALDAFLTAKISKLDAAIETLGTIQGDLNNPESDYNKALSAWKSSADSLKGESLGDNDLKEIEKLSKVLTEGKVTSLKNRIEAAKTTLTGLKNSVAKFKVLGVKWTSLDDTEITFKTLYNLLTSEHKSKIDNVTPTSNCDNEDIEYMDNNYAIQTVRGQFDIAYDSVISELQGTVEKEDIKTEWTSSEDAQSPNLTKDQRELYTWLYNNFYNETQANNRYNSGNQNVTLEGETYSTGLTTTTNEISSNKGNADSSQAEMENLANDYNNPTGENAIKSGTVPENRTYDKNYLPSGEWKETELEILKKAGDVTKDSEDLLSKTSEGLSFLDGLLEAVGNMATTLRDDMYIADYIMNQFSYSTFEAEITVANKNKYKDFKAWYTWNDTDKKYDLSGDFNTYANSAQMLKDARTLTKVSINPNANYLYGKEVEYILYGDGSTAAAYGTIYIIRFALNTVYAFTDAEINNITTAAATALFGVPPLTPLIPIAKIAMIIGLALAESAYDLYQLKCGEKVPLIKSSKTWMMKPSSAVKLVAAEAMEAATDYVIDQGYKVLYDALEMTDEELEKLINSGTDEMNALAKAAVDSTLEELGNYANQAIQKVMSICDEINSIAMQEADYVRGQTEQKVQDAIDLLDAWLSEQAALDDGIVYEAKKAAVDILKDNSGKLIGDIFDALASVNKSSADATSEELQNMAESIQDILKEIQTKADNKISELTGTVGSALNTLVEDTKKELQEAAKNGAESLKSKIKEKIGATLGTSPENGTPTEKVVSSLLAWAYSDYLRLFLIVALLASPESVLLRTADVIELNMQQINKNFGYIDVTTETEVSRLLGLIKYTKTETTREANPEAFKLSKSYTYLNVKSTIEVKPLMMTLPLMGDTVESQLTGTDWYQITYEGTMGY